MKFTYVPEASPLEGYTIKRAIHRGGFGEVYYALSDSGKEVALKLLNNNLEVELRGVSQCLNLKHANLVTIFDIREDRDGDHWIVMEYIGGRGLYEVLQLHPDGMPVEETLRWLSGIVAGLSFLHDRGIVHRDLKPANVFSDQDVVKVGDVGLSKYISESRRSAQTQSVGTVYYMAPEVCHGRYGREVDVYALGIMLVEMLTGQVPFDGETTAEILMKHMTAEPDLTGVPEKVRPVIEAALVKDPEQRIQDVDELERQFRAALDGVTPDEFRVASEAAASRAAASRAAKSKAAATRAAAANRPRPAAAAGRNAAPVAARTTAMTAIADQWNRLPVPVKWIVGGVAAVTVLETGLIGHITSGAVLGISVYLGYVVVQRMFGSGRSESTATAAAPQPAVKREESSVAAPVQVVQASVEPSESRAKTPPQNPPPRRPERHRVVQKLACYSPATPRRISKGQRFADLTNSLSISLAATFLVTLAVYMTTSLLREPAQAVFFGSVTMLAAWAVLIPGKLREGRSGDVMMRRAVQAGFGLIVGFLAFGLQDYLMLSNDPLVYSSDAVGESLMVGRIHLADGSGFPTMATFMVFFGALFAARRWWWQTDSFRRSRFRISSTLLTLLVGAVVAGVLHFPGPLGATWALAISAVVQLSAGWTPPEERLIPQKPRQSAPADALASPVQKRESPPVATA